MQFGDKIKQLREKSGMTQAQLGNKIGVSDRVIGYYESNQRFPRKQKVIHDLANEFNVPFDYLISDHILPNNIETNIDNMIIMDATCHKLLHENQVLSFPIGDSVLEDKVIQILTPELLKQKWSISLPTKNMLGDLVAQKDNETWIIDFKYITDNDTSQKIRNMLVHSLGSLALNSDSPITKYTIVTNNTFAYNSIKNININIFKITISVILIDLQQMNEIKEIIICSPYNN